MSVIHFFTSFKRNKTTLNIASVKVQDLWAAKEPQTKLIFTAKLERIKKI